MTCAAPMDRTSSTLRVLHTAVTVAPSAVAIWTAKLPTPRGLCDTRLDSPGLIGVSNEQRSAPLI
jgi:hypothetical protein